MRWFAIFGVVLLPGLHSQAQTQPVTMGPGVTAPSILIRNDPEYSGEATRVRVQSSVLLNIVVGEDGKARDVQVAQGAGFGLDEQAIVALGSWVFRPGTKEGRAVAVRAQVEMNFHLLVRDPEDRSNQMARLNFNLPPDAARPELIFGKLPPNPLAEGEQALRFRLQVDADGLAKNITVLSSTDPAWEQAALRVMEAWRFRPAQVNGAAFPAEGIFEIAHSSPPDASGPVIVGTPPVVAEQPSQVKTVSVPAMPPPRQVTGLRSRVNHSATRLGNGTVLLAGGAEHSSETPPGSAALRAIASAQIYDWATRKIVNTGDMVTARADHTATLLRDGTVLIAGGSAPQPLAEAEIYDPSTGRFSATGKLREARQSHTAALLPDGRVLLCGGTGAGNKSLSSAEIYDPRTKIFTAAGNMTTARTSFHAVTLKDGRILLAGGFGAAGETAEIYDPMRGNFRATGTMTTARYGFSATLLDSGQVLIAGGSAGSSGGAAVSSVEIYNPVAGSFRPVPAAMPGAREFHAAVLLGSGKVLLSGGIPASPGAPLTPTVIFDEAGENFSQGPILSGMHTGHTATLLQDGSVLVAGSGLIGYGNSAEVVVVR